MMWLKICMKGNSLFGFMVQRNCGVFRNQDHRSISSGRSKADLGLCLVVNKHVVLPRFFYIKMLSINMSVDKHCKAFLMSSMTTALLRPQKHALTYGTI